MVRMLSAGLCLVGWLCCVESGKVGTLGYSLRACGVRARDDEVGIAPCGEVGSSRRDGPYLPAYPSTS